jgi:hypothetical protein
MYSCCGYFRVNFEIAFVTEIYFKLSKNMQENFHLRKFILAQSQLGEETSIGFAMSKDSALVAYDATSVAEQFPTFERNVVPF